MKLVNIFLTALLGLIFGCTIEPKYQTPISPIDLEDKEVKQISNQELFLNQEIRDLITKALENNRNLKLSYLNIELARENYNMQKSSLFPTIGGGVMQSDSSIANTQNYKFGLSLSSYELDFFGKVRSATKSKKEAFLASKQGADVLRISLISEVANSFIKYLTLKQNIFLLKQNLSLNEEKYLIFEKQNELGYISQVDLLTAKNELEQNKIDLQTQEILLTQIKTGLTLLVGDDITDFLNVELKVNDIKINEADLSDAPSKILLSRPDIMQAEHDLKSANANIGVARANFFPSISITGMYGFASTSLSSLFSNTGWQYSTSALMPIFTGGRNIANLKISKTQKEMMVVNYEKAIQTAFKEVLDGLNARELTSLKLKSANDIFENSNTIYNINQNKYKNGAISNIDFINSLIQFNSSQIYYNSVKQEYLSSVIIVYKVTGQGI